MAAKKLIISTTAYLSKTFLSIGIHLIPPNTIGIKANNGMKYLKLNPKLN